jgi:hypothetical protein
MSSGVALAPESEKEPFPKQGQQDRSGTALDQRLRPFVEALADLLVADLSRTYSSGGDGS